MTKLKTRKQTDKLYSIQLRFVNYVQAVIGP